MIEKYTPSKEEINRFLQKIEQRISSNSNKPQEKQEHKSRL